MGEQRLTDLAILSNEKDLANSINLQDVVNDFAGSDRNRRIALV